MQASSVKIHVDLSALQHNLAWIKQHAPTAKILAMIKANAYGHGLSTELLTALSAVDSVGVATLDEALHIRALGCQTPILLMPGFQTLEQLQLLSRHHIDSVIHSDWQIALMDSVNLTQPINVWLKFDTGMGRLGFVANELATNLARLKGHSSVKQIVMMTHMACADEIDSIHNAQQMQLFEEHVNAVGLPRSLANSAAIMHFPNSHYEWVRPGLALYGCSPIKGRLGKDLGLRPVMSVTSHLIQVKTCHAGQSLGYGAKYHCPESMPVGIVAMGYADGYPREFNGEPIVIINGEIAKVIGRVSMDYLAVDLRGCRASVGDEVVMWGPQNPVESLAQLANTIPYTLLTGIGARAQYVYQGLTVPHCAT